MIIRSQCELESISHVVVLQHRMIVVHNGQLLPRIDQIGISSSRMVQIVYCSGYDGSDRVVLSYVTGNSWRVQKIGSSLKRTGCFELL